MANLKIYDLHTADSEIHELSNMNSFKICNLSIDTSQMRQLNNDELQNIIGGQGKAKNPTCNFNLKAANPICLYHGASCPNR
jgi:bacteriocin-like protein